MLDHACYTVLTFTSGEPGSIFTTQTTKKCKPEFNPR